MAKTRVESVLEYAEGDGNCAFNAFILGLSESAVLDHLPNPDVRFQEFIQRVQAVAHPKLLPGITDKSLTWKKLRDLLIHHKSTNGVVLQTELAPIMRKFAVDMLRKNLDAYYETTSMPLQDELESYFQIMKDRVAGRVSSKYPINHLTPGMGDIFIRHPFVQEAFLYLWDQYAKVENGLQKAKEALLVKWKLRGVTMFLDGMEKNAVLAGDLELAPLANYFGVNLDVDMGVRRGGVRALAIANRLPESIRLDDNTDFMLTRAVCLPLSSRGIIDIERHLERCSPEDVEARLGVIPHYAEVAAYISSQKPVKNAPVPASWPLECLLELRMRDIITRDRRFAADLSDVPADKKANGKENREAALGRIAAFPNAKAIAAAWKAVSATPRIRLANISAVHWNNIASRIVPVNALNDASTSKGADDKKDNKDNAENKGHNEDKNNAQDNGKKNPVIVPVRDLQQEMTSKFLYSRSYAVIDHILECRKIAASLRLDVMEATKALFGYVKDIRWPEDAKDRYYLAARYHVLLGLYSWSIHHPTTNPRGHGEFRASLQADLSKLANQFPDEFNQLSDQDDWDLVVRPCLENRTAEKVLAAKQSHIEKVFNTYDNAKWNLLKNDMHPSYMDVFNRRQKSKQDRESKTPWHLWKPAPDDTGRVQSEREMQPLNVREQRASFSAKH
jgi:hypothetical protein